MGFIHAFKKEAATTKYKQAYEAGDAEEIAKAQQILTDATLAAQQAETLPQQVANQVYQQELADKQNQPQSAQTAQQPIVTKPDKKAIAWQEKNNWFGADEEMTNFAYGVHAKLVKENVDPTSDEYYDRIDKRMKEVFPDSFDIVPQENEVAETSEERKSPISTEDVVAPATRNNGARPKKKDHIEVPVTIDEVVETAKLCFDEGAEGIHFHLRDEKGDHILSSEMCLKALNDLQLSVPNMHLQVTTEAVGKYGYMTWDEIREIEKEEFTFLERDRGPSRYHMWNPAINSNGELIFASSSPLVKVDFCGNIL